MKVPDLAITPHMTYGQMRRYADSLGISVCSRNLPKDFEGFYHAKTGMIIVDRGMTYTMKRCALTHELVHWSHNDDSCTGVMGARMEQRTRRETAALLIPQLEYATLENIYEGEPYPMAAELNVTEQVLKDYRELILDRGQYA
jgi:Zn-dependent peptidase ImmA (M78 family)